jgi:hypothetical protein
MWKYGETVIRVGRSWVDNDGVRHPVQWSTGWSAEEKAAKGLVWVDDVQPHDSRFYWGRDAEGALIPKNIDDVNEVDEDGNPLLDADGEQVVTKGLKTNAIALVKTQAGGLLAPTDWMVIKASEVGDYSVPTSVLEFRAAVRLASNQIEAAITACTDLASFMALYDVPVDADGNPTGNAPINDFPEADS